MAESLAEIVDLPTEYVSWHSPAAALWVATTPTANVGMLDRTHDGFVATDCTGRELGVYGTLESARVAVYGAWVAPAPAEEQALIA
jgi:hypothetical protein